MAFLHLCARVYVLLMLGIFTWSAAASTNDRKSTSGMLASIMIALAGFVAFAFVAARWA